MIKYLYVIFFFVSCSIFGQTTLKGSVIDRNNKLIPFTTVLLKNPITNEIIAYAQTDEKGFFVFIEALDKGVYKLVASHLSYQKRVQTLVISETNTVSELTIVLEEKRNFIEEVVIERVKPILIKKDTIIYNVAHFAKQKQQTIEEVLSDINGVRVSPNGAIHVKGRLVRKVLVNGKEVADVGALLLTKSLDTKQVQNIEVRFDEKSKSLQESLLDAEKYVVLDIKLRNSVESDFFGKFRLTNAYQDKYDFGYYVNLFSLKDNQSLHFFSEYDRFGIQTIGLKHIKYMGQEAFARIFEIPADFKTLMQKETYHSEVFDFDDFIQYNRGVTGVSFLKEISSKWQLFFGGYNSFSENSKTKYSEQIYSRSHIDTFKNRANIKDFSSKNKLEFKYDSEKTKLILNTNLVAIKNDFEDARKQSLNERFYNFNKDVISLNLYNNLSYEYVITDKLGFEGKFNNSYIDKEKWVSLRHNNPDYKSLFSVNNGELLSDVNQLNVSNERFDALMIGMRKKSKNGLFKFGVNYSSSTFDYLAEQVFIPSFSQENEMYESIKKNLYFNHSFGFKGIGLATNLAYGNLSYLNENQYFVNYKGRLSYSLTKYSGISGSYKNVLSSFPLTKLTNASTILNFNTIEIATSGIKPVKEQAISFGVYKKFSKIKLNTNFAYMTGKTRSQNNLFNSNSLVFSQRNQLTSKYQSYKLSFNKEFQSVPIQLTFEPQALFNSDQNKKNDIFYETHTSRWFLGFKIKRKTKSKWYSYYFYPKYTKLNFTNDLSKSKFKQEFMSFVFNSDFAIIPKRLFVDTQVRKIHFFDKKATGLLGLNIKLSGGYGKFNYFLLAYNLMNNREVVQKDVNPIFMNVQHNNLFSRYVKLGLEYKF